MSARGGAYSNRGSRAGPQSVRGGGSTRGGARTTTTTVVRELFKPEGKQEPDERITQYENTIVHSLKKLPSQAQKGNFPPRRGFGTLGEKTLVRANYFPVSLKPKAIYYRYEFRILPEEKRRTTTLRVLNLFIEKKFPSLAKYVVTDGANLLYAAKALPLEAIQGKPEESRVLLWWPDDVPPGPHPGSREYQVSIRQTGELKSDLLAEFVKGRSKHKEAENVEDIGIREDVLQAVNVILNKHSEADTETSKSAKNSFFPLATTGEGVADLGQGLNVVQGFYKSVRPSYGRLLCNVDIKVGMFYKSVPLIEAIGMFIGHPISFGHSLTDQERRRANTFLRAVKISVTHIDKKKSYFIKQIIAQDATQASFKHEEGEMTIQEYFRKKREMTLKYPKLQLVKTRGREDLIPMEVCVICPGQAFRGKITETQTSNMIRFACREPTPNAKIIVETGLKALGIDKSDHSSTNYKFGLKVDTEMVVVPARILPPPQVHYQGSKIVNVFHGKGGWNLANARFVKGCDIHRMAIVYFENSQNVRYNSASVKTLWEQFSATAREVGVNIKDKDPLRKPVNCKGDIAKQLKEVFMFCSQKQHRPTMMWVIIPDEKKSEIFSLVKKFGDLKTGIQTVAALFNTMLKGMDKGGNKQYFANLLLKINIRLGGTNHTLPKTALKGIIPEKDTEGPAMLVGMDVTHPSPGMARGSPSITSVVASNDSTFANYPCSLRIQERGEMIKDLRGMFLERLEEYKRVNPKTNGGKPPKIVIYRDGVSEGEFGQVIGHEFPQIRQACNDFEPGYRPPMTFIVVGKRHHTRFFPTEDKHADEKKNCIPGTIVDRGITSVYDFDFFLQAHKGLQGTTKPAHYFVLRDENGFSADDLQSLTMNLCHLFPRATKSISVCPPVKMADIACERGRVYLSGLFDDSKTEISGSENPEQAYEEAVKSWSKGVHHSLRSTMFYL